MYIYIYIYSNKLNSNNNEKGLGGVRGARARRPARVDTTVSFHNFNLRIFNLRVSNPHKLIVDVFFDTMSDFNVPGSRPNKNTMKFRKSTVIMIIILLLIMILLLMLMIIVLLMIIMKLLFLLLLIIIIMIVIMKIMIIILGTGSRTRACRACWRAP